jgi:hypothetical protein
LNENDVNISLMEGKVQIQSKRAAAG